MKWYGEIAMLACLCSFALVSCVPQSKTDKGGATGAASGVVPVATGHSAGRSTKSTPIGTAIAAAVAGSASAGEMMDMQELEMRTTMVHSEAAVMQRQGELLTVSLKGDLAFDKNSAAVRPGLFTEIERMANVLNRYPKTVIQVGGHTDSQGSEASNLTLSQQRADAVKNLMIQLGISQERIESAAYGESKPIDSNETDAGRMMNRRVEIKIAPAQ